VVAHPLAKLVLLGLLWAFLHHFCMGIRILLLDLNMGTDLQAGPRQRQGRAGHQPGADRDPGGETMVKEIIVGAHYGLKDWLAQRITAVVMAAYTLLIFVLLLGQERSPTNPGAPSWPAASCASSPSSSSSA
jgi:succinate dehydrogenase hydrophobic anchor subunit